MRFILPSAINALSFILSVITVSAPAIAHEFWLDPVTFTPKPGASVPIVHRNGMNFLGDSYPYQRSISKRFTITDARGTRPLKSIEGDDPAAEVVLPSSGLAIVAFERAADIVTYKSTAHFLETVDDEGLDDIAAKYRALTTPPVKIRERYSRYAKTLLNVGTAGGSDRAIGLTLEIVIDGDPYALAIGSPILARVLHDGKPVSGVQVKAFNRDDAASPRRVRTDANGQVAILGVPAGEVLLSAVIMMPGDPLARDTKLRAEWNSLWASLTFKRP